MYKVFADHKYKKYLSKECKKLHFLEDNITVLDKGVIANEHKSGCGVFSEGGAFIKSSLHTTNNQKAQFVPKLSIKNIPYCDDMVVFLCDVDRLHFGHFLLDNMNRAWLLVHKEYKNYKFVIINDKGVKSLPEYVYVLLGLLGIKRQNVILLNKTTQFRKVVIPNICFDRKHGGYNLIFSQMYDDMAKKVKKSYDYEKIYVSRTKLGDRGVFGEAQVQKIFQKNGYHIIYPETLSLEEQIAYMKNCKSLAGCAGTALHLALFMKPGGEVIQIKRNTEIEDNALIQMTINEVKGLKSCFISCSIEEIKSHHWDYLPQIIGVTEYLQRFFDEKDFSYTKTDIKFDKKVYSEYESLLKSVYVKTSILSKIYGKFIKYISCFVPGRQNRANFRKFLKHLFNI